MKLKILRVIGICEPSNRNRVKICCICGQTLDTKKTTLPAYRVRVCNNFGQDSIRNACPKCSVRHIKKEIRDTQKRLKEIPQYIESLERQIDDLKIMKRGIK